MKVTSPFGFDVNEATFKLSELFVTHGSCPTINNKTWKPWKAGKSIYQFWYVTPNKLGVIKSATPTLTLDGVDYLGFSVYLLSLTDFPKVYADAIAFPSTYRDENNSSITGSVTDFIPVAVGNWDSVNMSGVFYNLAGVTYDWNNIKPWCESGNIFVARYNPTNCPVSTSYNTPTYAGDIVSMLISDAEIYPLAGKTVSLSAGYTTIVSSVGSIPSGWTYRPLVGVKVSGVDYTMIYELYHTSGGRLIGIIGGALVNYPYIRLAGWWYPVMLFQYPLMKKAGVASYYVE